eukprot:CAMPEP_0205905096 /NCGR_PEP_ID=MMETSP1325-20131115/1149_1 /ASSEMBLY_ACC=CAM_ASM_000708 /TAXON_ID=236786 /ORGANISM="Florenciella sp., Strain RCC1007" /LENGTH=108 /DNA_ID=CAMNT_0053270975 /DNA_START=15 /DNA_END=341 /DNA_ORIENTATION=+
MAFRALTPVMRQAARPAVASVRPAVRPAGVRQMSGLKGLYPMFMDSNMKYLTFVFAGAIAVEFVYGNVANMLWENANQGKLVEHVDWSKWCDDEEEEEEEEDEDEDDE